MEASEEGIAHDLKSIKEVHGDHKGDVHGQSLPVRGEWLGLSHVQAPASAKEKGFLAWRSSLLTVI